MRDFDKSGLMEKAKAHFKRMDETARDEEIHAQADRRTPDIFVEVGDRLFIERVDTYSWSGAEFDHPHDAHYARAYLAVERRGNDTATTRKTSCTVSLCGISTGW
jgi:hypothetical protein